jgi:hypothetical protein
VNAAAARGRPDVAWVGMDSVDTAATGKGLRGLEASRRRFSAGRAEFVKGDRRGWEMDSLSEIAVG